LAIFKNNGKFFAFFKTVVGLRYLKVSDPVTNVIFHSLSSPFVGGIERTNERGFLLADGVVRRES
jgi:hypothetical protein